eukprot:80795-Amphidinium_carterae.2
MMWAGFGRGWQCCVSCSPPWPAPDSQCASPVRISLRMRLGTVQFLATENPSIVIAPRAPTLSCVHLNSIGETLCTGAGQRHPLFWHLTACIEGCTQEVCWSTSDMQLTWMAAAVLDLWREGVWSCTTAFEAS